MDQQYSVEVKDLGIKISTGTIAKQANGSVTISLGALPCPGRRSRNWISY